MRRLRTLLLAGGAVFALGAAAHAKPLPQTIYSASADRPWVWIEASPTGILTQWDAFSSLMDAQMAAMLAQMADIERTASIASAMPATSIADAPRGVCAESIEIVGNGDAAPRITRRVWGDCGGADTNGRRSSDDDQRPRGAGPSDITI
jgi:hypothetical protein